MTFWGPIWDPPPAVLLSNKHLLRTGRAYFPWRRACPPKWCCMVTLGCHTHDRPPDWLPPSMRRCPAAPGLTQRALLPAGAALPANGDPEPLPDGHRLTDLDTPTGQSQCGTGWHDVINLTMLVRMQSQQDLPLLGGQQQHHTQRIALTKVCGLQECWQQLDGE